MKEDLFDLTRARSWMSMTEEKLFFGVPGLVLCQTTFHDLFDIVETLVLYVANATSLSVI